MHPSGQAWPHVPQLALLVARSTHVPPQSLVGASHAHVPDAHDRPVPHFSPSGAVSTTPHTGPPLLQSIAPSLHGAVGVHVIPDGHATHAPPLQTFPVPHGVPSGRGPTTEQCGAPSTQSSTASLQGSPASHVVAHASPSRASPSTRASPSVRASPSARASVDPSGASVVASPKGTSSPVADGSNVHPSPAPAMTSTQAWSESRRIIAWP
jgi:hypothetical protein